MKNSTKVLVALGAGVAIGGLLGVLFAPYKGSKTRKKISEAGNDIRDKVKDRLSKSKDAIAGLKGEVEQVMSGK